MELLKYMPLENCPASVFKHLRELHSTVNIPVEIIVTEPSLQTPLQARIFNTRQYLVGKNIMPVNELSQIPNFYGTSHYNKILLAEVWMNYGSDGHIWYKHYGYRYVPENLLIQELKECEEQKWPDIPCCMSWGKEYKPKTHMS